MGLGLTFLSDLGIVLLSIDVIVWLTVSYSLSISSWSGLGVFPAASSKMHGEIDKSSADFA